jgi:hypothetical protein
MPTFDYKELRKKLGETQEAINENSNKQVSAASRLLLFELNKEIESILRTGGAG